MVTIFQRLISLPYNTSLMGSLEALLPSPHPLSQASRAAATGDIAHQYGGGEGKVW